MISLRHHLRREEDARSLQNTRIEHGEQAGSEEEVGMEAQEEDFTREMTASQKRVTFQVPSEILLGRNNASCKGLKPLESPLWKKFLQHPCSS